jgi:predicted amidohydrolase
VKIATTAVVVKHDKQANAEEILRLTSEAAAEGAQLIVFPEASLQGYMYGINHEVPTDELRYHYREAESLEGPTVQAIAASARDAGVYIIFGMVELAGAVLYNTAVLCFPDGHVRGFRKVHRGGSELHIFEAGTRVEPVATEFGKVGINICYDMCFPEIARMQALQGAELLVFPNAWPAPPEGAGEDDPRISPFLLFPRARAWENQCYVVTANIVGAADVGSVTYYGHSRIIDPLGRILADTGFDEGIVYAEVDLKEGILDARTGPFFGYNILKDRRPDVYAGIDDDRPFEPAR